MPDGLAEKFLGDLPRAMLAKPIPSSGEKLPAIGIGTYKGFDLADGEANRARLAEVLRRMFAAGGTIVDSSPMYGRAEARAGQALASLGKQRDAFIMTKVWTSGRDAGIRQTRDSMAFFGVERIALMQIHNLVDWRTHLPVLREWKAAGRFQYIGVTHYTAGAFGEVEAVLQQEPMDFLQIPYSIAERTAEARLLPLCREKGVAVIANVPLGSGRLMRAAKGKPLPAWAREFGAGTWAQFFLKYLLGHEACTCVIPGTGNPDHAADLLAAGEGRLPDESERRRMVDALSAF
jgi:diketogulonate reductase-like aldo/keto reductase